MPELPEIEATVRLLDAAVRGARVGSARAPGLATMRTFDPPLDALEGATCDGIGRRGKLLLVRFSGGGLAVPPGSDDDRHAADPDPGRATLVIHLMSAGRLQLYEKRAGMKDRSARILIRLEGGADGFEGERELRLREFGTRQAAWGALLRPDALAADETLGTLGPEAWPDPPDLADLPPRRPLRGALRDQRVIAGVGRTWSDEVLWEARLAPLRRAGDLDDEERERLRTALVSVLGGALEHYLGPALDGDGGTLSLPIKDKLPMPLRIHRRTGNPCPRCTTTLLAVHYEEDEMTYCPHCQTNDKPYKDRRLSRLLGE